MQKELHLIEPTLFDQTGHGFSYINVQLLANKEFNYAMHVWLDSRGHNLLDATLCQAHTYFFRRLRQLQKLWLYFKLIRKPVIIFVGTSTLWDLQILALYQRLLSAEAKVFLHFHQFKQTSKKLKLLGKIAKNCTNIKILTPTQPLAAMFTAHHLNASYIPCAISIRSVEMQTSAGQFQKILYAGAARNDKGFPIVVQLLQAMRKANIDIPFEIQISTPNSQRYDQASANALQQLQLIDPINLTLHSATLAQSQYMALFNNAICLLLYDYESYKNTFSGITIDAFYAGCPIITVKNTWMGDLTEKYAAGITLEKLTIPVIQTALEAIINNYQTYHTNAQIAAEELSRLHAPRNTLAYISDQLR